MSDNNEVMHRSLFGGRGRRRVGRFRQSDRKKFPDAEPRLRTARTVKALLFLLYLPAVVLMAEPGDAPAAASPQSSKACEAAGQSTGHGRARSGTVLAELFSLPGWNATQMAGYLASFLVIMTFCMREMWALRSAAIASNIAFMTYGYLAVLPPVFLLHMILLPVNLVRAVQLSRRPGTGSRRYGAAFRRLSSG